jgi:hypothetical protein
MTKHKTALLKKFFKRERKILGLELSLIDVTIALLCFAVAPILIVVIILQIVHAFIPLDIWDMASLLVRVLDTLLISSAIGRRIQNVVSIRHGM